MDIIHAKNPLFIKYTSKSPFRKIRQKSKLELKNIIMIYIFIKSCTKNTRNIYANKVKVKIIKVFGLNQHTQRVLAIFAEITVYKIEFVHELYSINKIYFTLILWMWFRLEVVIQHIDIIKEMCVSLNQLPLNIRVNSKRFHIFFFLR